MSQKLAVSKFMPRTQATFLLIIELHNLLVG